MPPRSPRFSSSDPLLDAPVAATLDLHGFAANEAESALRSFINSWKTRAPGAVLHVITGKGRGSKGAPVLKPLVRRLLKELAPATVRDWARTDDDGGYKIKL
jgi:DNA-nicking Smr family endonuclease